MRQGVLLTVAYDGTAYRGIAPQRGFATVGGVLLKAIQRMAPDVGSLRIASRTDAGVHARGQLVSFDTSRVIQPRGWTLGLAAHLPDDISIRRCAIVPERFDPRGWVVGKWYRYAILLDSLRDPFVHPFTWKTHWELDDTRANDAAQRIVGEHDFAAFRSAADTRENTVRNIFDVTVSRNPLDTRQMFIDVRGSAFLHNMVRIIAGTIVDVARGRLRPSVIDDAFVSRSRKALGRTAPAAGLSLQQIVLLPRDDKQNYWPKKTPDAMIDAWPGWTEIISSRLALQKKIESRNDVS